MSYETLFRNEDVFDFSHIPDQFNYRDSQLKALAYCLKPAMRSAKPLNALLIGSISLDPYWKSIHRWCARFLLHRSLDSARREIHW